MSNAKPVSDSEFTSAVLESTIPALVDFWATWCGPCQVMGPILDTIAGEYEGRVGVFKVNVDENQATPAKYGIRGIPTLVLFNNGEVVDRIVGAQPRGSVENLIKKVVG